MKKLIIGLMVLSIATTSTSTTAIVDASSVYDTAYTTSSDVNLHNQTCGPGGRNDHTATREDIINAVKAHPTYGPQLSSAITSGRVGVSNFTKHVVDSGGIIKNSIQVFWTPDSSMYLEWIDAFYGAPYRAVYAHGSTSTLTSVFVRATNDTFGNCKLSVSPTNFSSNLAIVSDIDSVKNNYIETDYPNYPLAYEGLPIGYRIQGNVTCANSNNVISAVHINVQNGSDKNAIISDDGNGGKNYFHYLTDEGPYSVVVVCDGDPFYGPTVNANFGYLYHWVCTTTGDQNYCAAS